MSRLKLSILAREEIREIGSGKLRAAVRAACRLLCRYPEFGSERPKLSLGLRGYPVTPYVIFYRLKPGDVVFVVRVVDGRRDIKVLFEEPR